MKIETYNPDRDRDAVFRILGEVGWMDKTNESQARGQDAIMDAGKACVRRIDGDAECMVVCVPGHIRYLAEDLPFSAVAGVITSRVARKQGLAGRLTAHSVAREAKEGALVSGLAFFEQGFYDRVGFGTGPYEHWIGFDPTLLNVPFPSRPPKRFTTDDYDRMHQSRLNSTREHGYVTFPDPKMTHKDQCDPRKGFGLGYVDETTNEITHHLWVKEKGEHGPYQVSWLAYRSPEEFIELMGVIRSLGDQVRMVSMTQPANIQIQDLLNGPLQNRMTTHKSRFETFLKSNAYWQNRINDLPACLAQTHLSGPTTQFNLELTDPIDDFLEPDETWKSTTGEYTITLGEESQAIPGTDLSLPTMKTTTPCFTRLWLGCQPPTGLAYTDKLDAPPNLLKQLDTTLNLPTPDRYWDF